jgi:polyisoprenoid-binding protein YceI
MMLARVISSLIAIFLSFPIFSANYTFDPSHSFVEWQINHFGFSNPSGKWFFEGTLNLDEKNPANSEVAIRIPLEAMVTGIPKLTEHLNSPDFFDVKKYPLATFESQSITVQSQTATIKGLLSLHGVTRPLTLHVKLNKLGMNPISHKKTAGFSGDATLKRSDFQIDRYLPGLSDSVKLNIEAEANLN